MQVLSNAQKVTLQGVDPLFAVVAGEAPQLAERGCHGYGMTHLPAAVPLMQLGYELLMPAHRDDVVCFSDSARPEAQSLILRHQFSLEQYDIQRDLRDLACVAKSR